MRQAASGGIIHVWRTGRSLRAARGRRRGVSEQNKALIRRLIKEVERGNLNVIDELLAPDFVDRDLLPGQEPDRQGYKRGLSGDHAAFSDLVITIEDQIAEGDKVVTRFTWRGTHDRGNFMGKAPTGKKVEAKAIFIHRISGGKVKEEWSASDTLETLRQPDAAPTEQL
jgi:predicted ester cyclase